MNVPNEYELKGQIHRSERSELWNAVRRQDGQELVLKRYTGPLTEANASVEREFGLLQRLDGSGIPRAFALLEEPDGRLVLAREKVPGISLREWIVPESLPDLATALAIVQQVARVLGRIHTAGLVHRQLHPGNIIVEPQSAQAYVLGFGSTQALGSRVERQGSLASRKIAEMLAYVAPEQTGRMGRGVDYRSDLYMLGATLYQVLVGTPPFDAIDPLALIHSHLARVPTPPIERRPNLPLALSRMTMKLLEKEPDLRYQRAHSLVDDLQQCRAALEQSGSIAPDLPLGESDSRARLDLGHRLYGRDEESEILLDAYHRVRDGATELVLLSGAPGSGKSALVARLRKQIAGSSSYFALCKSDASRKDSPYRTWGTVIESWVDQVLVEREERLQHWATRLRESMRGLTAALFPIVPSLELVTGEMPTVPELAPRGTRERLAMCVQYFLTAVGTAEHPLVVVLDDLQWADAASLQLLETLLQCDECSHLLIIATLRSEDMEDSQRSERALERFQKAFPRANRIDLGPLSEASVAALLQDLLSSTLERVQPLARYLIARTESRPLDIQQFLLYLRDNELLTFGPDGWEWDETAIAHARIPETATAFLLAKLAGIPGDQKRALQVASCIGGEFEVGVLVFLCKRSPEDIQADLLELVEAGFLAPCAKGFRFSHDRIREASQALLSERELTLCHAQMAEHLLSSLSPEQRAERIFELLDHVNRSLPLLQDTRRMEVIELNFDAGKRALRSGAGAAALSYFSIARSLLSDEQRDEHPDLAFELCLAGSESAFQAGNLDEALRFLEPIDDSTLSPAQFASASQKRLQALSGRDSLHDQGRWVRDALAVVGEDWPLHPSPLRLLWLIYRVRWLLERSPRRPALRHVPDSPRRPATEIIDSGGALLARSNVQFLVQSICFRQIWTLREGYCASPALTLGAYASFIALRLWGAREANRILQVALEWRSYLPSPGANARLDVLLHGFVRPYLEPRWEASDALRRVAANLRDLGDPEYGLYAWILSTSLSTHGGLTVPQAIARWKAAESWRRRAGHETGDPLECARLLSALESSEPVDLAAKTQELDQFIDSRSRPDKTNLRTLWMMVLCVHGEFELAFEQSKTLWPKVFREDPYVYVADYVLYRGIAAAAIAGERRGSARRDASRALRACRRKMVRWAKDGPDFVHMAELLAAEIHWTRGRFRRAIQAYRSSIDSALHHKFVHHAGLAADRLAARLEQRGNAPEARLARIDACQHYSTWGALARARELEAREVTRAL